MMSSGGCCADTTAANATSTAGRIERPILLVPRVILSIVLLLWLMAEGRIVRARPLF
jgi:hypothetical protein